MGSFLQARSITCNRLPCYKFSRFSKREQGEHESHFVKNDKKSFQPEKNQILFRSKTISFTALFQTMMRNLLAISGLIELHSGPVMVANFGRSKCFTIIFLQALFLFCSKRFRFISSRKSAFVVLSNLFLRPPCPLPFTHFLRIPYIVPGTKGLFSSFASPRSLSWGGFQRSH